MAVHHPNASERGTNISGGPQLGRLGTESLPFGWSPTLQSLRQSQQRTASGQIGHKTPAVFGNPNTSKRGTKSSVALKWVDWLHHHCRIGGPKHFRAGNKIRSRRQVGKLATSSLPSGGTPTFQSGEQNQKWPTCGRIGCITTAVQEGPQHFRPGGGGSKSQVWTCNLAPAAPAPWPSLPL